MRSHAPWLASTKREALSDWLAETERDVADFGSLAGWQGTMTVERGGEGVLSDE